MLDLAIDQPFSNTVRQMNKMMDQFQKGFFNFCPAETWTPSVNLYETETAYLVCVDLAGVDKEKIDVEVVDNQLRLRGTREVPTHADEQHPQTPVRFRVHLMEIDHGPFCREVDLPHDVIREQIGARHRNGLLWIELPKKQ